MHRVPDLATAVTAPNASTGSPRGLAFDAQGNWRSATEATTGTLCARKQRNLLRPVDDRGYIYGIAGNGADGDNAKPVNGSWRQPELPYPEGVSIDSSGDAVIGSELAGLLLVSRTNGDLETIAGNRSYGYDGDGIRAPQRNSAESLGRKRPGGDVAIVDGVRFADALHPSGQRQRIWPPDD